MVKINIEMPKCCSQCPFCLYIHALCAYCMATGYQLKMSETDLRDGMCPLREIANEKKENSN